MIVNLTISVSAAFKITAVLTALAVAGSAADQPSPKPFSRAQATKIIADAHKVVNPGRRRAAREGADRRDRPVGTIRGTDRRNPVLLLIHGGHGYVSMPMSWWFARGWEEYLTVVQWDQHGAGKTYLLNDPAAIPTTLMTHSKCK